MLNGSTFEVLVRNGYKSISSQVNIINELNVFPVADGDTGSNMAATIEHGINHAQSSKNIGEYLSSFAKGVLLGARGNSGVIFSQIIKGIADSIKDLKYVETPRLVDALVNGYQSAYLAVAHPEEGTMLTVARLGIENIKDDITKDTTTEELFKKYVYEMRKVLSDTPNMLPALKEAGVVDSGGMGYVSFFEGVANTDITSFDKFNKMNNISNANIVRPTEDIGYCTEFIINLNDSDSFNKGQFVEELEKRGNSIVCIHHENIVKVHIHSLKPLELVSYAENFGKLYDVKIEDMYAQGQQAKAKRKKIAYVAVCSGEGTINTFRDLGCDIVIDGGQMMNTSTKEFLTAFETLDSDHIIVLPNNSDIQMAALQAKNLYDRSKNVYILPTKTIPEGYFAISMIFDSDKDIDEQLEIMKSGMNSVSTLIFAKVEKEVFSYGVQCSIGDYISIFDKEIICSEKTIQEAIIKAFSIHQELLTKETFLLIKGKNVSDELCDEIVDLLYDNYSDFEVGVIDGGQEVYDIILGVT